MEEEEIEMAGGCFYILTQSEAYCTTLSCKMRNKSPMIHNVCSSLIRRKNELGFHLKKEQVKIAKKD